MTGFAWASRITLPLTGLAGLVAFGWPLFISPAAGFEPTQAPLLFGLTLALVLAVVLADLTSGGLDTKALAMLGVLAAIGAILRPLSAGTAGIDLIFFLLLLGGRVFGASFGFAQGALTLFTSALLTGGVGPWLPYQMLAAGFVAMAGRLLPTLRGRGETVWLSLVGFVTAFGYGWLMDFAFWPFGVGPATQFSFDPAASPAEKLHTFVLFNLATSMGWNLGRAVTNVALIVGVGGSLLRVLRRAARRGFLVEAFPPVASGRNTEAVSRG